MSTKDRIRGFGGAIVALSIFAGLAYAATTIAFTGAKLLNGWAPGRAYTAYPGYGKDSLGVVHLRGSVKGGHGGDEAFIVPKALAPAHSVWLPIFTFANNPAGLQIAATGQVIPVGPTIKYLQPLDGMNYVPGSDTKITFTRATLENGWKYGGNSSADPGYAIDALGVVHLRGGLAGTSSGQPAFVLPAALRPGHPMWVPIYTSGATEGSLSIDSAGEVTPSGTHATGYASLDGVSFVAGSSTKVRFTNAKLLNGWHDGGYGSAPPGYAKDSLGIVHLRGGLGGQTESRVALVLPKPLRPSHELAFPLYTVSGTEGMLVIETDGRVIPFGGEVMGYASLDGINFVAGQ
jgi:hypothetical protein